jgi:hypothetical protein
MKSVIIELAINIKILNIITINETTTNTVAILVIKLLLKLLKNNAAIAIRNIKQNAANKSSIQCISIPPIFFTFEYN